jgi:hypothetical protein
MAGQLCPGLSRLQERGLAAARRFSYKSIMILRALLLLTAFAGAATAELRTWTLPDGRTLNARISGIDDGKVLLLPSNGNTPVPVFTHKLAGTDRAAVDAWVPPGRRAPGANAEITRNPSGWPLTVALKEDPAFTVVEENREAKRYVYRSDHFEFTSRQPLNLKIVREFSRLFELTYETVAALPLRLDPEPPRGYYQVVLFATNAQYVAAGGPKRSGGLYRGSTGEVMVPLPSLGVRKLPSDRWIMEDHKDNQPLLHEVTHQVMGPWLTVLPMWLIEGAAEYVAAARCSMRSKLTLHASPDNLFTFLREQMGVPNRAIDMRHPQRLMVMDFDKWQRDLAGRDGIKNYYSAMLLFYYYAHLDGDGTGRHLMDYFKARVASETPDDDTADRDAHLLRGRTWEELWSDIARALAAYKVKLS